MIPLSRKRNSFSVLPFSKITLPFLYDFFTNVFTNSAKPSLLKGNSLLKNKNNLSVSVIFIVYTVRFGIIATNVLQICDVADLEALNFQFTINVY
jgi:hypothetical protein